MFATGKRDGTRRVEDDVVGLAALGEILLGVVDHLVRPNRAHELDIGGAADPGYFGAEVLRDLYRRRADATGSADDQDVVTRLMPALSRRNFSAFVPPNDRAAASSNDRFAGLIAISPSSAIVRYSAWEP